MKCPFKKITQTEIEYKPAGDGVSKPKKIERKEHFGECDGLNCIAYDGGICLMIEEG